MRHRHDRFERDVQNLFWLAGCLSIGFGLLTLAAATLGVIWLAGQVL